MSKGKQFINNLSYIQKIIYLISILGIVFLLSIALPTLARYKNKNVSPTLPVWDGSVATKYRRGNGSVKKPYIISNGSELAYFYTQLQETDYKDMYFQLSHDIVLNSGIFTYNSKQGIQYIVNDETYYVDGYTGKYYEDSNYQGSENGTVNIFNSLDGFKGNFKGNSFTIYGLYISNEDAEEVALFTNLEGNVHDLYVDNAVVYGGLYTGGIASKTNNSTIRNVLFDGYVIGKDDDLTQEVTLTPSVSPIILDNIEKTNFINLNSNIPFVGGEIISTSISGNYVINDEANSENVVKINGEILSDGTFEIDLGSSILSAVTVSGYTDSLEEVTVEFNNLQYNVAYKYAVAGGIVSLGNNTLFENVINKADVYGHTASGGLVGAITDGINIKQSYNTGEIISNINAGGLAGVIEQSNSDITIFKSYNSGNVTANYAGGLIGIINNNLGKVTIQNVFDALTTNYSIVSINDSEVFADKYYYNNNVPGIQDGVVDGLLNFTIPENLRDKDFMVDNLSYNEFIDYDDLNDNQENVWIYENDSLPVLFMDSINKPVANIHVSIYSWNNFSTKLKNFKFTDNITFSIKDANELMPNKEIYYYISNERDVLTKDELDQINDWVLYEDIVQITEEELYVIYAKVVDYDDVVTYINTDLLILDLPGTVASIEMDEREWSELKSDLETIYFNYPIDFVVKTNENVSPIASLKYYITDEVLTEKDLDQLSDSSWVNYDNKIMIDQVGENIIYVQIIDDFDYITYINTDMIILDGYMTNDIVVGRNSNSYLDFDPDITNKSTISLNFSYSNNLDTELTEYRHTLLSNLLLPIGTKITLIDNVKHKVYNYQIPTGDDYYNYNDSCKPEDLECIKVASYPFTLFKEVGAIDKYFVEDDYYLEGLVEEDFTVILDLSNASIVSNYNDVSLYLELRNESGDTLRRTLTNTIKRFNVYSDQDVNAKLYLTTNYVGDSIIYNSDSSTNVNISSGLNYKQINDYKIIDTTYEDKEIGLAIKFVDSEENLIDKEHLKNIFFKIGENKFYPDKDSIIRINLNNGISDFNNKLTIVTKKTNNTLESGTYYFKISNYVSIDGYYYDNLGSDEITIPVKVSEDDYEIPYGFDVLMESSHQIIDKKQQTILVSFDILQFGSLKNPNIKVSLYKKKLLTAYDQNYIIVDLADYVSDTLNEFSTNLYYVTTNPVTYSEEKKLYNHFELNLLTDNFDNTGYKFVFDLYDGNKKIGTIDKYFIVK